jgi:hypothetical protein
MIFSTVIITARILGQNEPIFNKWFVPLPFHWKPKAKSLSLQQLLCLIAIDEIEAWQQSEQKPRFERLLTYDETVHQKSNGRAHLDGYGLGNGFEAQTAAEAAIRAFKDGLYYVFVDGEEIPGLDVKVDLKTNGQINFFQLLTLARD